MKPRSRAKQGEAQRREAKRCFAGREVDCGVSVAVAGAFSKQRGSFIDASSRSGRNDNEASTTTTRATA